MSHLSYFLECRQEKTGLELCLIALDKEEILMQLFILLFILLFNNI